MNHTQYYPVCLCILVTILYLSCHPTQQLFQSNQTTWKEYGAADWKFSDSEIMATVKDGLGFLMTSEIYDNFTLELEFFPDQTINSGVFIRCETQEINFTTCYEFNIWDDCPDLKNGTGSLVRRVKPSEVVKTKGKWNSYKIVAHKNHIQAWINGTQTIETKDMSLDKGFLGIQAYGIGIIKFRNIKIKSIKT